MSAPQDSDTLRRRLTRRLFFGLPLVAVAAAARPEVVSAGTSTSTWTMEGNSDVDDNDFIGSINDKSLVFKTKNVERMRITNSGRVGINNTNPTSATLQAQALGSTAIRGDSGSTGDSATGVWGQLTTPTPTAGAAAVRGVVTTTTSPTGVGVVGLHSVGGTGVLGVSSADNMPSYSGGALNGAGVVGAGGQYGVLGISRPSAEGGGVGVAGRGGRQGIGVLASANGVSGTGVKATASGHGARGLDTEVGDEWSSMAVRAVVSGPPVPDSRYASSSMSMHPSDTPMGVYASGPYALVAEANGAGVGVFGTAAPAGFAGYFVGRVRVEGAIQVGGGDSELDPQHLVSSPDQLSTYSGNVQLDSAGEATVTLEFVWGRTFTDVRYQLTPVGAPAPNLHIVQQLDIQPTSTGKQGTFRIAGGSANLLVSWRLECAQ